MTIYNKHTTTHTYKMKVRKYLPNRFYGFASCESGDTFFHLSAFKCPLDPSGLSSPPPIIGEFVDVVLARPLMKDIAFKAKKVTRLMTFSKLTGVVVFFNSGSGFGKIKSGDHEYFLHRSEVGNGKIPMQGDVVTFFAISEFGERKPRACHVEIEGRS